MGEVLAEVRVVVHPSDRPAAVMDHEELAVRIIGSDEVVLFFSPPDAERWLDELSATVREALGTLN